MQTVNPLVEEPVMGAHSTTMMIVSPLKMWRIHFDWIGRPHGRNGKMQSIWKDIVPGEVFAIQSLLLSRLLPPARV
jgi:hypothetical protein